MGQYENTFAVALGDKLAIRREGGVRASLLGSGELEKADSTLC